MGTHTDSAGWLFISAGRWTPRERHAMMAEKWVRVCVGFSKTACSQKGRKHINDRWDYVVSGKILKC